MNLVDQLICGLDDGLRSVFGAAHAERKLPADASATDLPEKDKAESIRLMRVNHAGEVSAQALYQGQAAVARDPQIRRVLIDAAREERDHLAWCETRLHELGGDPSRLNPVFYAGSFALGMVSGALGDKWSMGFLVETERQVESHLSEHLSRLPEADHRSREILAAMREDEAHHADTGVAHGGAALPQPVRTAMSLVSRLMTRTSYWV
jgi:3-demethoxyubiquinol 3-hydroxylase